MGKNRGAAAAREDNLLAKLRLVLSETLPPAAEPWLGGSKGAGKGLGKGPGKGAGKGQPTLPEFLSAGAAARLSAGWCCPNCGRLNFPENPACFKCAPPLSGRLDSYYMGPGSKGTSKGKGQAQGGQDKGKGKGTNKGTSKGTSKGGAARRLPTRGTEREVGACRWARA